MVEMWRRGSRYAGNGLLLWLALFQALTFGAIGRSETRQAAREAAARGVIRPTTNVLPMGLVINLLANRSRRGGAPDLSGGGGGSFSALDAPSTEVYNPEPAPAGVTITLPQEWLDSRYDQGGTALTFASDVTLNDSGNAATNFAVLQSAMDNTLDVAGHSIIRIPDGFVAEGIPQCGVHTQGDNFWTYVRRQTFQGTDGTPITQGDLSGAPIFRVSATNRSALETLMGAQRWAFDEIVFETTASQTQVIVHCGPLTTDGDSIGNGAAPSSGDVDDLPNHIYFRRCWVKGRASGGVVNGMYMNTKACAFVDGIIDQIWIAGFESHALASFAARGPFKIVGNTLEASAITVLFGGADPFTGLNTVPQDIEFRRNRLTLRDSWNPFGGSWDSTARPIKNRLEFKMGVRALVEGNIIEKSPLGGQNGEAFVIKSMAGENGLIAPWYKTEDIYCRYNSCHELWNWLYITGVQMAHLETLGGTNRVVFQDNLIYNYAHGSYGSGDCLSGIFPGDATNVQYVNVTAIPHAASLGAQHPRFMMASADVGAGETPGLVIRNSILHSGRFDANRWAFTNTGTDGEAELDRITGSSYTLENSFLIDGPSGVWASGEMTLVASIAAMNFTGDDPSAGLDGDSPAKSAGTDGNDAGCNYTKVNLATSGV